ncbi:MAG: hypothetical protein KC616_25680 [Myxococcales bacterium]|nr:hypothetical protein [Myxococcales bacterium]
MRANAAGDIRDATGCASPPVLGTSERAWFSDRIEVTRDTDGVSTVDAAAPSGVIERLAAPVLDAPAAFAELEAGVLVTSTACGAATGAGAEASARFAPPAPASSPETTCSPPTGETGRPEVVARAATSVGGASSLVIERSAEGSERRSEPTGKPGAAGAFANPSARWASTIRSRRSAAAGADASRVEAARAPTEGSGVAVTEDETLGVELPRAEASTERRRSNVGGGGKARSAVWRAARAASDEAALPLAERPVGTLEEAMGTALPGECWGAVVDGGGASPAFETERAATSRAPGGVGRLRPPPSVWRLRSDTSEATAPGELGATGPPAADAPLEVPDALGADEDAGAPVREREGAG